MNKRKQIENKIWVYLNSRDCVHGQVIIHLTKNLTRKISHKLPLSVRKFIEEGYCG